MMVNVKQDITGWVMREHGVPDSMLTVIKQVNDHISPNGTHYAQWLCKCECGNNNYIALGQNIKSGSIKSCGCSKSKLIGDSQIKLNNYVLNLKDEYGEYGYGICYNTGSKFYFDMDDYNTIKNYCWYEDKSGTTKLLRTVTRIDKNKKRNKLSMHGILGLKNYDHIDRNELNNRRHNLRPCSPLENSRNKSVPKNNTSGVIGVCFHKTKQKWISYIYVKKQRIQLGQFLNKDDAIKARLQAEKEYFKEFAPQKHLFEQCGIKYEGCDKDEP